jgi:hypothetical protein
MSYRGEDDWLLSLPLFHVSGQGILWRWLRPVARLTVREKAAAGAGFAGLYSRVAGSNAALAVAQYARTHRA